jgi:hypothetical protein
MGKGEGGEIVLLCPITNKSCRLTWIVLLSLVAFVMLGVWVGHEPTWGGHSISYWLDEWDTHQRLGPEYSKEPVVTVQHALDRIETKALPQLMSWLKAEDSPLRTRINALLERQTYLRFRFQTALEQHCLAEKGFCYYGDVAKPIQRDLLAIIRREHPQSDRYQRFCCALFLTRPERELFLPVCRDALNGPNLLLRSIAAQWIVELYPEDASEIVRTKAIPSCDLVEEQVRAASELYE